jgi:hypothetical protein
MQRWVLKSRECFEYVFKHGDVDSAACVVPVNAHAQVPLNFPFQFTFVMFIEDGGKVLSMFLPNILDAKIVHTERERYRSKIVALEARCEGALTVAMFVEACFEGFLCEYPCLGEVIHALLFFDVDESIGVSFVGKVIR